MTEMLCILERKLDILLDSEGYSGFSVGCER